MEYLTVCSIAESLVEEECDWDEVQQVEVSEVFFALPECHGTLQHA